MKRVVAVLTAIFVGLLWSGSGKGENLPAVVVEAPNRASQDFEVKISIEGVEDLYGWSGEVMCYDVGIKIKGIVVESFPDNGENFLFINDQKNYARFARIKKGRVAGSNGSGLLATIFFEATETSTLNLDEVIQIKLSDSNGENISYSFTGSLQVKVDKEEPLINLNPLPECVNTKTITVSGNVSEPDLDYIKINDVYAAVEGSTFTATLTLEEGDNPITVEGKDNAGNTAVVYKNIVFDETLPVVYFSMPEEVYTYSTTYTIKGRVEDNHEVAAFRINGEAVEIDENGSFEYEVLRKSYGPSQISVEAEDKAGNFREEHVVITFLKKSSNTDRPRAGVNTAMMKIKAEGEKRAPGFLDLKGHWAQKAVDRLYERGIIKGYPDGTFRPDEVCLRGEFLVALMRILKVSPVPDQDYSLEGIPLWGRLPIITALEKGILKGFENGSIGFFEPLNRNQMAVFLHRALGLHKAGAVYSTIRDYREIPVWAKESVAALFSRGILRGFEDGSFRGNTAATRGQMAVILDRVMDYVDLPQDVVRVKEFPHIQSQKVITIIQPQETFIITPSQTLHFEGFVEQGYTLKFEGEEVDLDEEGNFSFDYGLDWGWNNLTFRASNGDSESFTVYCDNTPPVIDLLNTFPADGSLITSWDGTYPIKVKAMDFQTAIDKSSMLLAVSGINKMRVIQYSENELGYKQVTVGIHAVDLEGLEDGRHFIYAEFVDAAGNKKVYESSFILDTQKPEINILHPVDGDKTSGPVTVGAYVYDVTLKECSLFFSLSGEEEWLWVDTIDEFADSEVEFSWDTGELESGYYDLMITAEDEAGNTSNQKILLYLDNTPPGPVAELMGESDADAVVLTWQHNPEDDVECYRVYRAIDSDGPFTFIGQTQANSYNDTGLLDATYYYQVRAQDNVGNISDAATTIQVTVNTKGSLLIKCNLEKLGLSPGIEVEITGNGIGYQGNTSEQGSILFEGLNPGDYTVKCGHPGYVKYIQTVTLNPGQMLNIEGELLAGDVNGDDAVDLQDLDLIFSLLNTTEESDEWEYKMDYNGDDIIDIHDMVISSRNVQ